MKRPAGGPTGLPPAKIAELLVVGTGPVARALVVIAEAAAFHVRVAAGPDTPSVGEFEGADEVIVTPTPGSVEALRPGADTFVVLCSDDEGFSEPVLKSLASTNVPYIGIVSKTGRPLAVKVHQPADSRIHSPAGVGIGADTPEEIAISILAEVVAIRRGLSREVLSISPLGALEASGPSPRYSPSTSGLPFEE